ncbi:hypothetical protein [Halarchaeum acidiphilum]|uniref:hypothetical protein n=1 Tax=Halarchaeum acidiphilum TaxID=489138 RepID=UPI000677CB29|nr:hypothetical protein [Halarchaeum acidiphilum]
MPADPPDDAPTPRALASVFSVYEVAREGERVVYYGDPLVDRRTLQRTIQPLFGDHGYDVRTEERPGETALVAAPASAAKTISPFRGRTSRSPDSPFSRRSTRARSGIMSTTSSRSTSSAHSRSSSPSWASSASTSSATT